MNTRVYVNIVKLEGRRVAYEVRVDSPPQAILDSIGVDYERFGPSYVRHYAFEMNSPPEEVVQLMDVVKTEVTRICGLLPQGMDHFYFSESPASF